MIEYLLKANRLINGLRCKDNKINQVNQFEKAVKEDETIF